MIDPERLGKALPKLIRQSGWTDDPPEDQPIPLDARSQQNWDNLLQEPTAQFRPRAPWAIGAVSLSGLAAALLVFALLRPTVTDPTQDPLIEPPLPAPTVTPPVPKTPLAPSAKPAPIQTVPPKNIPPQPPVPSRPKPVAKRVPQPVPKVAPVPRGTALEVPPVLDPEPPLVDPQAAFLADYAAVLCQNLKDQSALLPDQGEFAVLEVPLEIQDQTLQVGEPVQVMQGEGTALATMALQVLQTASPQATPAKSNTFQSYRITLFSTPGMVACEPLPKDQP